MRIGELIVVEGKDDIAAVKNAVDADVLATGGFGIKHGLIVTLRAAVQRSGVIIFTDPDSAGNRIRKKLNDLVPGCKNAYLPQNEGLKGKNIGVENASPEAIRQALARVNPILSAAKGNFVMGDLVTYGLSGTPNAEITRKRVGAVLGIGETNAKQFLNRLNNQGISRKELLAVINEIREDQLGNCL